MRARRGLKADREGALYTIEAIVAIFLAFSALACVQSISGHLSPDGNDDLELMSADVLYLLEHGGNGPGRPGLAQTLASPEAWAGQSAALTTEIQGFLPAGCHICLQTPYGDAGDCPPDFAAMSVRPFLAYSGETGAIVDGRIIVWRP